MKILSPLDDVAEVVELARAGAGEFYCGLLEEEWHAHYPVISINRRPAGKGHFRRFADLGAAVSRSHDLGIPVFFAINEHYYTKAQYPLVRRYVEGALEAGIDAFIVTDFGLIAFLKEYGSAAPVHISTGGTVFNWRAASFFKDQGVARITFPRHLELHELAAVVARMPDMEKTVFILNSRCINVDGFCTFQHGLAGRQIMPMYRNACMLPYHVSVTCSGPCDAALPADIKAGMLERQRIWQKVHLDDHPCGACALYEFSHMGMTSVKIVGRGNPLERKLKDVGFLKRLLDELLLEGSAQQAFRRQSQALYQATYGRPCRQHMCYFPSVMRPEDAD